MGAYLQASVMDMRTEKVIEGSGVGGGRWILWFWIEGVKGHGRQYDENVDFRVGIAKQETYYLRYDMTCAMPDRRAGRSSLGWGYC